MTYQGIVENGIVVLPPEANLPSGTKVLVEPLGACRPSPTLAESLKDFIGLIPDLPKDFARNHDHYVHGAPKQ